MNVQPTIKEVIETLCLLLYNHGHKKINAETFRLAKFNREEARDNLYHLIIEIIRKELVASSRYSGDDYLLLLMYLKNIDYPDMIKLMCNEEADLSSQELLIVFGFIVQEQNYFEKLLHKVDELLTKNYIWSFEKRSSPESSSAAVDLNHIIVLKKKIDLLYRECQSNTTFLSKIISKVSIEHVERIHREMSYKNFNCRLIDLIACSDYKMQNELSISLNKQISLYKLHIKWIKCEPVFWQWMNSVFKERNTLINIKGISKLTKLKFSLSTNQLMHDEEILKTSFEGDSYKKQLGLGSKDLSLNFYLTLLLTKNIDELKTEINNYQSNFHADVKKLENYIKELQMQNQKHITQILDLKFPNCIQLPFPRT